MSEEKLDKGIEVVVNAKVFIDYGNDPELIDQVNEDVEKAMALIDQGFDALEEASSRVVSSTDIATNFVQVEPDWVSGIVIDDESEGDNSLFE